VSCDKLQAPEGDSPCHSFDNDACDEQNWRPPGSQCS